jgi:hypothetical protein
MKPRRIDPDALNYARLHEGKRYYYSLCEDGTILRTQRNNLKVSKAKISYINGKAFIYIGRIAYKLDSLVARHFIESYKLNDIIEHIDGKEKNCAVWNLRIIPRAEYNKGKGRNKLAKSVMADGVLYPSVIAAAEALFVERSTLDNFLKGKYKTSMLDGHDIRLVEAKGG